MSTTISYHIKDTTRPIINSINHILPRIPIAIIVLMLGILAIRVLSYLIRQALSLTSLPRGLQSVISSLTDVALWVFLVIALLQEMGLNNVALALTGSFAFVVLGLSQGGAAAVADVIGGLTLAKDHDFNVGDHIQVIGKIADGVVEAIDLRHTRIRGADGQIHVVPNSVIDKAGWILFERGQSFTRQHKKLRIRKRRSAS